VRRRIAFAAAATTFAVVGLWAGVESAGAAPAGTAAYVSSCGATVPAGYARCMSVHRANPVQPLAAAAPGGYGPSALLSAYSLDSSAGSGQVVAIVDAFDDPNAESDLATYRSQYGLPACSTANGCFSKLNQRGASGSYPSADSGWATEISLDVDMASAICPQCKIVLVEADSNSFADLGAAENTAAAHASVVSDSWGGGDAPDATYGQYFNHPGVAITASAGDSGFQGASYPASSQYVMAIGGTTLRTDSSARGWSETVWNGTGSGCSTSNAAIAAAAGSDTGCSGRAMNDVSAVADPSTGVAVYNTYQAGGWNVYGGTSVSSPIIASIIALAGNGSSVTPGTPYGNAGALYDVTSGSNGSCNPTQLCTARAGWDGPTGLGTPNGTAAF